MTVYELLKFGKNFLKENNIDNYESEANWLLQKELNYSHTQVVLESKNQVDKKCENDYKEYLQKRVNGVPVQYILGSWEFYGYEFKVGEGVLIPRPETEILVENALDSIANTKSPIVIDLCAGTGCIGLSIAKERKDSTVYLVEKYQEALNYLIENSKDVKNAKIIQGDVLTSLDMMGLPKADLLVSNPPYIKSCEIPTLQSEVQLEPHTALDGGEDGLKFYRAIKKSIKSICKGFAFMECGEGQAEEICKIFGNSYIIDDYQGIGRIVVYEGENNDT